jgi:hypothetical protein
MAFLAHFALPKCPVVLGEVVGGRKMKDNILSF